MTIARRRHDHFTACNGGVADPRRETIGNHGRIARRHQTDSEQDLERMGIHMLRCEVGPLLSESNLSELIPTNQPAEEYAPVIVLGRQKTLGRL